MRILARFFLTSLFIAPLGCGSSGDKDPNEGDPLAAAEIVRCDMPDDHVCREYQRGKAGDATAFVDLPTARSICRSGWPGGPTTAGTFAEGSCSREDTLGRCFTQTHTLPILYTLDFFYTDFGDTASREDPLEPLETLCANVQTSAAAQGVDVTSTFQIPPYQ